MADKPQIVHPAEVQAAGNRMHAHMDEQTEIFYEIARTGEELALTGMQSSAGNAAANKLNEIRRNADMQRDRSRVVASGLQEYASQTAESADSTASTFNSVEA